MPKIEITTIIGAPREVVFDYARCIDVHEKSQSSHKERAIAGRTSGLIELGETVTWEAIHLGIRQHLSVRITAMSKPKSFVDEMLTGAFARFTHEHHFQVLSENETRMIDLFDYTAPLGPLGRLADFLFLESYMKRLLTERNLVIKTLAEDRSER